MRFRPLDLTDPDDVRAWSDLKDSVYLGARVDDDELRRSAAELAADRVTVVDDDGYLAGAFRSFDTQVSVPGGALIPANAVSGVLVRPTHKRRGLLTEWMTTELARARDAGAVASVLFASEATIYGRFGFGPVTARTSWTLEVPRARFRAASTGTLRHVGLDRIDKIGNALHPSAQRRCVGSVTRRAGTWRRLRGEKPGGHPERIWAVAHHADTGDVDGLLVYRIEGDGRDHRAPTLVILDLLASDRRAEQALWQHCARMDFIGRIEFPVASPDCALPWWLSDPRAATEGPSQDGLWLRVHDVERFLQARRYPVPGRLRLRVQDDLGQIGGVYDLLADADGHGHCHRVTGDDAVDVSLTAAALATLAFGAGPGVPSIAGMQDDGSLMLGNPAVLPRLTAFFSTPEPRWSLTDF